MKKIIICMVFCFGAVFAQTYTDRLGRSVEVKNASKLVCIGPGALRLAVYLGLEEKLVGIEGMENEPNSLAPYRTFLGKERIAKLPIIGTGGPGKLPNLEALITLNPDVIIASFVDKNQMELITAKTGIPVVALSYGASYGGTSQKNLDEIKHSLLFLGELTQVQERAKKLVAFIQSQESELLAVKLAPKTLYVGGVGYKGVQGITSTEADYPPFELLRLKNSVFEGTKTQGHQFIEFEALLHANPQIIFIDMMGKQKIAQDYATQKVLYDSLSAYQTGNVKEILGFNNYSTNVENLLLIAWQIADFMGEKISLEEKAKAIYTAFYGERGNELLSKLPYALGKK